MNDLFHKLAQQSGFHLDEYNQVTQRKLETFFDLIVTESVKICKSRVGNSDYNTGRMHCASDIIDHFLTKE